MSRVTFDRGGDDTWLLLDCGHYIREGGPHNTCPPCRREQEKIDKEISRNIAKRIRERLATKRERERLLIEKHTAKERLANERQEKKEQGFIWRGKYRKNPT